MAAPKYKEYFQKMLDENKEAFDAFAKLHMDYSLDQATLQEKFNMEGEKIMEIVREYENKLCSGTERGMYNHYSAGLADKFQSEVRAHFPLIDNVGLIVQKFNLKKISI
jgi:hypothetical protein